MGREITGLPNVIENFSKLEKGVDYAIAAENPRVHSERNLQDFFVFVNPSGGQEKLTIEPPHWRVITWPDIDSELDLPDREPSQNEPFFCVSTKGVGYLKPSVRGESIDDYETWMEEDEAGEHDFGYKMLGLSSADDYLTGDVMRKSERLLARGLRTEAYWGIAKLKKVYFQGQLTTIQELKSQGVILEHDEYTPYEAVRLLKNNDRIEQVYKNAERRKEIFNRAFQIYNRENSKLGVCHKISLGKPEDEKLFLTDFYRRMGKNIAVLVNLGYIHFRLHSSNITMAAEIVDIGTLGHWSIDEGEEYNAKYNAKYDGVRLAQIKDFRDIIYSLKYLRLAAGEAGLARPNLDDCRKEFIGSIKENLDESLTIEQGTDPEGVVRWIEKITDAIWLKNIRLPALQHHDITDWPIV